MLNGCAYILTVDVGNTFIRFGLFAEDSAAAQERPLATCEITTPARITADEARMRLVQVMAALAADAGMPGALVPAAAVLSCVVPALERPWKAALFRTCTGRVLTVGPGLKTGIPVHYDDPAEIGPDRIADAVAARAVYGSPCIVIDLGTTTNIEVIDAHGTFGRAGVIAPGWHSAPVRSRRRQRAYPRLSPRRQRTSSDATRVRPCARVWFWAR